MLSISPRLLQLLQSIHSLHNNAWFNEFDSAINVEQSGPQSKKQIRKGLVFSHAKNFKQLNNRIFCGFAVRYHRSITALMSIEPLKHF